MATASSSSSSGIVPPNVATRTGASNFVPNGATTTGSASGSADGRIRDDAPDMDEHLEAMSGKGKRVA